ncbi:MAG: PH domain-containing protein [Candidatus Micrarchaeia archaeon]
MDTNRIRMSGRKYYLIELVLAILVSIALWFIPVINVLIPLVWLAAVVAAIITYIYVRNYWIEFEEDGLNINKGVINVKTLFLPYANIDNVEMDTRIMDRMLGLTEIRIDTKGRADVEVILKNIPKDPAIEIVNLLRKKIMK